MKAETATAILAGIVIWILGVVAGQYFSIVPKPDRGKYKMAPSDLPSPICDALVKLSVRGKKIVPDPDPVCLAEGRSLTWDIVNDGEVNIQFVDDNGTAIAGPFQFLNNINNPAEGQYVHKGQGRLSSNKALRRGRWKYTVKWKLTDGTYADQLDPAVCVRD